MDLIELARQFGEEIQNDEIYIKLRLAEQQLELDDDFKCLMKEFNEDKVRLNQEICKESPDENVIKDLNLSIEKKYNEIVKNSSMISYQKVQKEFMDVMKRVNAIISKSAQGENPRTADYTECGGSCSSCDGCH